MYYKSVNRGLQFSKAGVYCIGYVMMVGLLAIISGVNALYLFLSTGMALLIISGLLSERVMRFNNVVHLESKHADADTPFPIRFTVENSAARFSTYGLDVYFLFAPPKLKLISHQVNAPISGRAVKITPGESRVFFAQCSGLKRGLHESIIAFQKTGYPFGFLEKFKFKDVSCHLVIAPSVDAKLLALLLKELQAIKQMNEDQKEFYAHRSYSTLDSLRYIDWRRSAGKDIKDWVVKVYKTEQDILDFQVEFPAGALANQDSEKHYEALLSRVRTAVLAVQKTGFRAALRISPEKIIEDEEAILEFMAKLPKFKERHTIFAACENIESSPNHRSAAMITVTGDSFSVETPRKRRAS